MRKTLVVLAAIVIAGGHFVFVSAEETASSSMSFFVTSENIGNGGDLGGLAGADAHCQSLVDAAGAGDRSWRAYLSTSTVNARDRIGQGPWHNHRGS